MSGAAGDADLVVVGAGSWAWRSRARLLRRRPGLA